MARRLIHPRSMRVRALLVSLAVVLLPLAFVGATAPFEAGLRARMEKRIEEALREALIAENDAALRAVALRHGVRVRAPGIDEDRDTQGWWARIGTVLLGGSDETTNSIEADLPPIVHRPEVIDRAVQCRSSATGCVVQCAIGAIRDDSDFLYITHSTRRPAEALYDVRYQLVKLSLVLPLAAALGLYLGWRMVQPVEELTRRVRVSNVVPRALALDRSDEIGDLSNAFAALTHALIERAKKNEVFVADLAHEMKNPLAAIRAVSEALDDGSERSKRLARVLSDASGRLDAIVTHLFEIARGGGSEGAERGALARSRAGHRGSASARVADCPSC